MSSEGGELGLSEAHEAECVEFLRWSRGGRKERLRAVSACFDNARKSRLQDSTFTREEVMAVMKDLEGVLEAEVGAELINTAHTSLLLLRQMMGQAEAWHLRLKANLSELENYELLSAVRQFEEGRLDMSKKAKPQMTMLRRLEPIEGGGGVAPLLQAEISRLKEENARLSAKTATVQGQAVAVAGAKTALSAQLSETEQRLKAAEERGAQGHQAAAAVNELEQKMSQLQGQLQSDLKNSKMTQQQLTESLTEAQKRFLEVREQLEMTEKELEVKFAATGAYRNLKGMLTKKNQQLKDLRSRLAQYEAPEPAADD